MRAARLDALLSTSQAIVMAMDAQGRLVEWSEGAARTFGWTREEALGQPASLIAPPERKEEANHNAMRLARGEVVRDFRTVRVTKDGARLDVSIDLAPVRDASGAYAGAVAILHDLAEQRRLERHVQYLERSFGVLTGILDAAASTTDLTEIYHEACRMAVERGGLRMAWIGLVDPKTGLVTPVAHAGQEAGYLVATNITTQASARGMGPSGRSIRERRPIVTADIEHDPTMAPWRDAALARGYRSAASFPIRRDGEVVGCMSFYSAERDYFTPSAVSVLGSIADALSFATSRTKA